MRSVVVVLPASMCAMMPMLRTLLRSVVMSTATVVPPVEWCAGAAVAAVSPGSAPTGAHEVYAGAAPGEGPARRTGRSPAVVRERPVRLGHLVRVLATLDRGSEAVRRVEDLVHEALGHRLLAAGLRVGDQPAQRERHRAGAADLDGHLVGRTADAAAADLERRLDVVQRALERDHGVGAGLLAAPLH